jgi:hypothetical protein
MNYEETIYLIHTDEFSKFKNPIKKFVNLKSNGPKEVYKSLLNSKTKGIKKVTWKESTWPKNGSNVIILADFLDLLPIKLIEILQQCSVLIGPNVDLEISRNKSFLEFFKKASLLAPSIWVQRLLQNELKEMNNKIEVWPAGIDTDFWKPRNIERDSILIYVKSKNRNEIIKQYLNLISRTRFKIAIIEYGKYNQTKFLRVLNRSLFCIWFGDTESQSMAQFQAWSMNTPTFVLKKDFIQRQDKVYTASSSPYLCSHTGSFFEETENPEINFQIWLNSYLKLEPRKWVLQHHKIQNSHSRLRELFPL